MKSTAKLLIRIVGAVTLLFLAILGDAWLRQKQTKPLAISGLPVEGAEVSGFHMPDFLWANRKWWIKIDTQKKLVLRLDAWTGEIPPGTNMIYQDHDHTNTGEYGDRSFWGFPDSVQIMQKTMTDEKHDATE